MEVKFWTNQALLLCLALVQLLGVCRCWAQEECCMEEAAASALVMTCNCDAGQLPCSGVITQMPTRATVDAAAPAEPVLGVPADLGQISADSRHMSVPPLHTLARPVILRC